MCRKCADPARGLEVSFYDFLLLEWAKFFELKLPLVVSHLECLHGNPFMRSGLPFSS
jgi:hypothetical protein